MGQIKAEKDKLEKLPVSAKVVIRTKDDKVLVMRKRKGVMDLPGGKIEQGEAMFDALTREMEEETGFSVNKFTFITSWIKTNKELGDRLVIVFEGKLDKKAKNTEIHLSDEHDWAKFLSPKKAMRTKGLVPGYVNAFAMVANRIACEK